MVGVGRVDVGGVVGHVTTRCGQVVVDAAVVVDYAAAVVPVVVVVAMAGRERAGVCEL